MIDPTVGLVIQQPLGSNLAGEIVDFEGYVFGVQVGNAVGNVTILSRVLIIGFHLVDLGPGRFVFIKTDFLKEAFFELGIVIVDVDNVNSDFGRSLFTHALIGVIESRHCQTVGRFGFRV